MPVSRSLDPGPRHCPGATRVEVALPASRQVAPKTLHRVDWDAVPGMHPRPVRLPHPQKWHLDFNSVTSYQASHCRRPRSQRCRGGDGRGRQTPAPPQLDGSVNGRKMGRCDDGDSASGTWFVGSLGPRSVYGRNGMPNAPVEGSFQALQVWGAFAARFWQRTGDLGHLETSSLSPRQGRPSPRALPPIPFFFYRYSFKFFLGPREGAHNLSTLPHTFTTLNKKNEQPRGPGHRF